MLSFVFRARGDNIYSTLIHFKHGGAGNWQKIVDRFMDFIKVKIIFNPLAQRNAKIFSRIQNLIPCSTDAKLTL